MTQQAASDRKKVRIHHFREMKSRGEKIKIGRAHV